MLRNSTRPVNILSADLNPTLEIMESWLAMMGYSRDDTITVLGWVDSGRSIGECPTLRQSDRDGATAVLSFVSQRAAW